MNYAVQVVIHMLRDRSSGKVRYQLFQQALQEAIVEAGKPRSMRMDWNKKKSLPFPNGNDVKEDKKVDKPLISLKRERNKTKTDDHTSRPKKRGFKFLSSTDKEVSAQSANLLYAIEKTVGGNGATTST